MARREFIAGANFSGRSESLRVLLQSKDAAGHTFYIGPYAEAALSGLSSVVRDEIALYRTAGNLARLPFAQPQFTDALARDPQSLSGGEQVLLALHCFSQSDYATVAIDTALEQLDPANRAAALHYIADGSFDALLIDNRDVPSGWAVNSRRSATNEFIIDWHALAAACEPPELTRLTVSGLTFAYQGGPTIFCEASFALEPGHAYRVSGPNGAGKTTFFKLLVGVLVPNAGEMTLGGVSYAPWRTGNRALALATQNPDQQWCGATLREDMSRRRKVVANTERRERLSDERLLLLSTQLGVPSLDRHLYELPLAARKRLSWCLPFAGAHPWIMLDEPTVGQDRQTRDALAHHLALMCRHGYGVMFVSHDDEFAAALPHDILQVADQSITRR